MKPGDFCRACRGASSGGLRWYHRCAGCDKVWAVDEKQHTITQDHAGEITIDPSVVCPSAVCGAHYWVRRGVIEWVS